MRLDLDLKPCPFCGFDNLEVEHIEWNSSGICTELKVLCMCGASVTTRSNSYVTKNDAIAKWNSRKLQTL